VSYLDRLKRRIAEVAPQVEATKVSEARYVPFVAPLYVPSRQTSESDEPANINREAFDERAAIIEFDGGLPRAEAEFLARGQVQTSMHLSSHKCCGYIDGIEG